MRYDRLVVGYHGCDDATAERVLAGEPFKPSKNDFDWLGEGVYFWENGAHRALGFAEDQVRRRKVERPTVVGALIQLGLCFDLLDTRFTTDIADAYPLLRAAWDSEGKQVPENGGTSPDKMLRRLDCAVLNSYLELVKAQASISYQTVRGAFQEGGPVFPESGIFRKTHIQIAVRDPSCIIGVFRPMAVPS